MEWLLQVVQSVRASPLVQNYKGARHLQVRTRKAAGGKRPAESGRRKAAGGRRPERAVLCALRSRRRRPFFQPTVYIVCDNKDTHSRSRQAHGLLT